MKAPLRTGRQQRDQVPAFLQRSALGLDVSYNPPFGLSSHSVSPMQVTSSRSWKSWRTR
jgi:hypothetical protein